MHATLRALDQGTNLGGAALDLFTRDVYLYLVYTAVRRPIDALVARHLGGERCVVVGHSLGSVVGYNVLRATRQDVVRFVTLGSPLGIRAVRERLAPPLGMPRGTTSWFNAFDPRDVVALRPLDTRHFPTTPQVLNKSDVDNPTTNRHGIVGYLPDPDVAAAIHTALTS